MAKYLQQLVSKLLIFSLVFSLFSPMAVFATDHEEITEEEVVEEEGEEEIESIQSAITSAPLDTTNGSAAYSVSGEKTLDNLDVDYATGALNYSYPIITPSGRNGIEAQLGLSYNSQRANYENILGFGWELNIPKIERYSLHGVNTLYEENRFKSSISGELLAVDIDVDGYGTYTPRNQNENFLTYTFLSDGSWIMEDKTGHTYKFGLTANSKQSNPADATQTFAWFVERTEDLNGNFMRYDYFHHGGQVYPYNIYYTGYGSDDGSFRVTIARGLRDDTLDTYNRGFLVETDYLIDRITVHLYGADVKVYELAYTDGDNGSRSILESIQLTARSGPEIETMPATSFTYEENALGWTDLEDPVFEPLFTDIGGYSNQWTIIDANGDSLDDIVGVGSGASFINRGEGIDWDDAIVDIPLGPWGNNYDVGVRQADVDGDLKTDLLHSTADRISSGTPTAIGFTRLHNADDGGWTEDLNYILPIGLAWNYAGVNQPTSNGSEIVDVNGDGLPDLLQSYGFYPSNINDPFVNTYLNSGDDTGWEETDLYHAPFRFSTADRNGIHNNGYNFYDANKDGLVDINGVYNDGNGSWPGLTTSSFGPAPPSFYEYKYFDVNGDGVTDILRGDGYSTTQTIGADLMNISGERPIGRIFPISDHLIHFDDPNVRVFDINGDGLLDIIYSGAAAPLGDPWTHALKILIKNGEGNTDQLKTVHTSTGAINSIEYGHTAQETLADGTKAHPNLPLNVNTVASITRDNGLGETYTTSYEYEGGHHFYESPVDKTFAGFNSITTNYSNGLKVVQYFHQGDESHRSLIGKAHKTEVYDADDDLMTVDLTNWTHADITEADDELDAYFVYPESSVSMSFDGNESHKDKASTYTYDLTNGNLTEAIAWGEVNAETAGTFSDIGTDGLKSVTEYIQTPNLVGYTSSEAVYDLDDVKLAETQYFYDELPYQEASHGNLTKQSAWLSEESRWLDTIYVYNDYGLATSVTNPRDFTTSITYDTANLYIETETNHLAHTWTYDYDLTHGIVLTMTDQNDFTRARELDPMGREIESYLPHPQTGTSTLVSSTSYNDEALPRYSIATATVDGIDSETRTYIDGLDQPLQTWSSTEDSEFTISDTWYDEFGNVEKQSLPYFSSDLVWTGRDSTVESITYDYDALNRPVSQTSPVGTTSTSYSDWTVEITDANAKTKKYSYDAFERLETVEENNGTEIYETEYEYDGLGNLTKLIDAQDNERNFTYDSLSRKTSQEDLHTESAADFGTWTYTYDDNSNVETQTDPKSQVISWSYDEIDRPEGEDWNDDGTDDVSYTYDTALNGTGFLASTSSPAANIAYSAYDSLGNITIETKTIDGTAYTTESTFDLLSRLKDIDYPSSNLTANYTYNESGQMESAFMNNADSLVSDLDYSPAGQVSYIEYGNGTATTNTFLPEDNFRLTDKTTTGTYDDELQYIEGVDLYVTDTVFDPARLSLNYSIGNDGSESVLNPGGRNSLSFDGAVVQNRRWLWAEEAAIQYLEAGGSYEIEVPLYLTENIPDFTVGTHSFEICVDSTDVAAEVHEDNNCDSIDFDYDGSLPDLYSDVSRYDETTGEFTFTIGNSSDISILESLNGRIRLKLDGRKLGSVNWQDIGNLSFLEAQGSYTHVYAPDLGFLNDGTTHELEICVDSQNLIAADADDANDCSTIQFTYAAPLTTSIWDWLIPKAHATETAGNIQDLNYVYDSVGNIDSITDTSITPTAKTMDYSYDDLYRLETAASTGFSTGDYSRNYAYDELGNMLCKSDLTDADCLNGDTNMDYTGTGYPTPHAVSLVDGVSYTYDNNGNLTNNGEMDFSWNIINQIESSGDMSFTYDHSGQRVKTVNSVTGEETIYVNPYLEIRDGEAIYYLYAGGQRVASIKDYGTPEQEITYFHQDHLGGVALATDEEGVVVQVNDYYPFGSSLLTSQLTSTEVNHSFTDKEYEEDLGLYYFEARWMDPRTGRFISEDPLDGTTYSYAANNPLIIIDPTGLYIVETGEIEADDTQDIITDALSDALGIDVSWDDVVGAGFYNPNGGHSYEDGDLVDMVGWFTHADASSPNITSDLNARNDAAAANYNVFSDPRAAWDYAHGEGDLKYDESSVYGARYENGDRKYWSYVYEGQLVRYDAPGNIHLGYVASEGGRMPWAFIYAGNVYSNGGFDDAYDVKMLYWGYQNATPLRDVYRTFR